MKEIKLITTQNFGSLECNFYQNSEEEFLLTREQIGTALEYKNPIKAIQKIHLNHKDRLEPLCMRVQLTGHPQTGGSLKSQEQERVYYTQRGIMEICRWSRQKKAHEFMDWCWDVIERYRKNQYLSTGIDINAIGNMLTGSITLAVKPVYESVNALQMGIKQMQIQNEELLSIGTAHQQKPTNPWFLKMHSKFKLLEDYFHVTRSELYKNILREMENLYGVDTNQIRADFCYRNNVRTCLPMEPYEYSSRYRDMIEFIVNTNLQKYGLINIDSSVNPKKHKTIFDLPVNEE